jgi:hypothetical protein
LYPQLGASHPLQASRLLAWLLARLLARLLPLLLPLLLPRLLHLVFAICLEFSALCRCRF